MHARQAGILAVMLIGLATSAAAAEEAVDWPARFEAKLAELRAQGGEKGAICYAQPATSGTTASPPTWARDCQTRSCTSCAPRSRRTPRRYA